MKVHHLNCGTMCPAGRRFVNGDGGAFERGRMVCHCLLVETTDGLLLVDAGLGFEDVASSRERLGGVFVNVTGAKLDVRECAAAQIEHLGFTRDDVRHVAVTHLDLDHAGGLSDFPRAKVHVHAPEHAAAMARATFAEKNRYRPMQWAHGPAWSLCEAKGEAWRGFPCVRALEGLPPEILMIPLEGHSRGHAAIAVDTGKGWLVHAGDGYFFHGEMEEPPRCTAGLALFQRLAAFDDPRRRANQARLRELARENRDDVTVFSAHSDVEFERLVARAAN